MIDLRFRPFDVWPQKATASRRNGTFRASYNTVLDDLERELTHLGARDITVATGHRREDIRNDGWPRANARQPHHPGVIVYFQSRHGALSFACDTFTDWKDNLRGVGLTLEALRAVDRYGATKRGEQYRGYAALPSATDEAAPDARREAAARLLREGGYQVSDANVATVLRDPDQLKKVYGAAVLRAHPDQGGTAERFMAVRAAADTIRQKGAGS